MATEIHATERASSAPRCAFCHGSLDESTADHCASCRVELHRDCRAQLGRCPTLGCPENRPASPESAPHAAAPTHVGAFTFSGLRAPLEAHTLRGDAWAGVILSLLAILAGVGAFVGLAFAHEVFSPAVWGTTRHRFEGGGGGVLLGVLWGGAALLAVWGLVHFSRSVRALARLRRLVAAEPTVGVLTVENRGSGGWRIQLAGQAVGRRREVSLAWGHAPAWLCRAQEAEVRVRSLGGRRGPVLIESNTGDLALVFPG